jgi:hypothetical protein
MGLSPREQHVLEAIREALAGSELAALLATFSRLVSGEEMPAREPLRAHKERRPHRGQQRRSRRGQQRRPHPGQQRRPRQGKARSRAQGVYLRLGFHRVALLLWLVVTVALISTAVVLDRSSQNGCPWVPISAAIQRSCAAHDAGLPPEPPGTR